MNKLNEVNEKIGKYRWTICALLFVATTMNYTDRQVLALLKDVLEVEFNWTDTDYANITAAFQFTYAFGMLFAGRFIDWIGTKWGYACSLIVWTIAGIGHGFATGKFSFMALRAALGVGEAGGFPAAIKATAEYFPKKERALATGIFNSGTNIGAIITPLVVPWSVVNWGWQWAFFIIAGTNLPWLIFWFWLYEIPSKQKRLSKKEYEYILSDNEPEVVEQPSASATGPVVPKMKWYKEWGKLLTYKQTWSFATGKFLTDGVWWFFLFWLPAYLKAVYGMTGTEIMLPIAALYTMTCVGSIGGGAFSMYFIRKGYEPYAGRMRAMIIIAFFPLVVLLAQPLGSISYWLPVILIGIGASAHQAWSANIFTTVSDMFPKSSVASVTGIGGMAGGIGGILINKIGGWLFDAYRKAGIADFWEKVKATDLAELAETVRNTKVINRHGDTIDLNIRELENLSQEAMMHLQSNASLTMEQINQLIEFQRPIVQGHMATSYAIMFTFCAVAYLLAWIIMKSLVPRYKAIHQGFCTI
jgi:ACS family hexuronate transporter-like MFS transporter